MPEAELPRGTPTFFQRAETSTDRSCRVRGSRTTPISVARSLPLCARGRHRAGVNPHHPTTTATKRQPVAGRGGKRTSSQGISIPRTATNAQIGRRTSDCHRHQCRERQRRPSGQQKECSSASLSQTREDGSGDRPGFPACRPRVPCLRALRVLPANSAWAERSFFPERFCFLWRSLPLGRRCADRERSGPP